LKFWSKIEISVNNRNLVKNYNFAQTSKFPSKIEIVVKNYNFSQKSKFPKMAFMGENYNFGKNRNFRRKWKYPSKIAISVENYNFAQKSKLRSKIASLVENKM